MYSYLPTLKKYEEKHCMQYKNIDTIRTMTLAHKYKKLSQRLFTYT